MVLPVIYYTNWRKNHALFDRYSNLKTPFKFVEFHTHIFYNI